MLFNTIEEHLSYISPLFIPLLQNNDIIISGSTAVYYCMKYNNINPGFIPDDIDVFVGHKSKEQGESFFKSLNRIPNTYEELELARKYEVLKTLGKSQDSAISNVKIAVLPLTLPHDAKKNIKIDFVFLSDRYHGTTVEHIQEDFDLDFCKCWYDGIKLYGPADLLRAKKCTLTHITLMTRPVLQDHQLVEYYESIRNLDPHSKGYFPDRFRTIARIRKYTARGFTIDTSKLETPQHIVEAYIRENIRKMSAEVYLTTTDSFKHIKQRIPTIDEFKKKLEEILIEKPSLPPVKQPKLCLIDQIFTSVHFMHFFVGLMLIIIFKLL